MEQLTATASKYNLIVVIVHTPSRENDPLDFYNWWDTSAKGDYARDLVKNVIDQYHIDRSRIWLTAYSGGADMVMSELVAKNQNRFTNGGVVVMGGGNAEYGVEKPNNSDASNMPLLWVIGDEDGDDEPSEFDWSAKVAAYSGWKQYREAGFTNTDVIELPDQDHNYDIAAVIKLGLAHTCAMQNTHH